MIITPKILYFGTPIALLSTENEDGSVNLAPISSVWALDQVLVLGLGSDGHTAHNLRVRPDLVVNVPGPPQWTAVERIADLTGSDVLPDHKRLAYRHCRDKFAAAGLSPVSSLRVRPPRVAECPLQLESRVERMTLHASGEFYIVQATVLTVHADPEIVVPGTSHIDPRRWSPLIYNFRHYFALGEHLGHNFRSETPMLSAEGHAAP